MNYFIKIISLLILIFFFVNADAQRPSGGFDASNNLLKGTLLDAETKKPMKFASVVLFSYRDTSLVDGAITDETGQFEINEMNFGKYFLIIKFVGYQRDTIKDIKITPRNPILDLGKIEVHQATTNLSTVEVVAEETFVEYKIDRKVVNVGKDVTAKGGTAIEALKNVPSVNVNMDDEVELRGSTNFTVLINGKPTPLSGSDALDQIPVSQIKNIEIITNPSAKYDPEGMTGIVNVVLKENLLTGISGLIEAGIGSNGKYNANAIISYRNEKFNVYAGGDFRKRFSPGGGAFDQESYFGDTTLYRITDVDRTRDRLHFSGNIGLDYYLNKKNTLGISFRAHDMEMSRDLESTVHDYSDPNFLDQYTINESLNERGGPRYSSTLRWDHNFDDKGHKFAAFAHYDFSSDYDKDSQFEYLSDTDFSDTYDILSGVNTIENDDDYGFNAKFEYEKPIKKDHKLEAGAEVKLDGFDSRYTFNQYDTLIGDWEENTDYSSSMIFVRNIYSVYGIYSGESKGFGYQFGLRGEYADRYTEDENGDKNAEMNKISLFPTVHLSKSFKKDHKVLLSYSRRIRRPQGWSLEPFPSYISSTIIRKGNPELKPSYSDNYELSYQKSFGKSFVSLEAFYKINKDNITRLHTINNENITTMTFANVDDEQSLGLEAMLNLNIVKWMGLNLSGSYYNYKIQGDYEDFSYDKESNNYSIRGRISFKILKNANLQFSTFYNGPSVTASGERDAFYSSDAGLNYRLLDNKLSLNLRVRDIFNTAKWSMTNYGINYISHNEFNREPRVFMLSASYKINNYRTSKTQDNNNGNGDSGGDLL